MTIKQNLVPQSKWQLKCPHPMEAVAICVHNTANDASAKNEISYMVNNTNSTSFHLAVDDIEAWQGLPLDRAGWHAGDGATGGGNRKTIGVEICYSKSGGEKFAKAEENAAELIAQLLKSRNWGIERVKKHQDFSGKYCPHRTLDLGWERFLQMVKKKLEGSMADMYTLPSGNKVDLANRDSNIVTAKTWDEVIHQKIWVKKSEVDALVIQAEKKGYEKGFEAGKNSVPTVPTPTPEPKPVVPEGFEVNGVQLQYEVDGVKVTENYAKKG